VSTPERGYLPRGSELGIAWLARAVARRPFWVLFACAAGVAALASGLRHLRIDRSADALIMPGDPDRLFIEGMKARFGSDDLVIVALVPEGGDVFTPRALQKLSAMTRALQALPGVAEVKSLATANYVEATPAGVSIAPLFRDVPAGASELAAIRAKALADPLFRRNLVAPDAGAAALVVFFTHEVDRDLDRQFEVVRAIEERALSFAAPDALHVSGLPVVRAATARLARRETRVVLPLLILANALFVTLVYRSLRGLLLPVLVVLISLAGALGLMGHMGVKLNPFTNLVPLFVVMLAAVYAVHAMTEYYGCASSSAAADRVALAESMLRAFAGPFAFVVLTTFLGFVSLVTNAIPAVSQLGVYTALATLVMFPACALMLPAVLRLLPPPRPRARPVTAAPGGTLWGVCARLAHRRPLLIVGVWVAAAALGAWGAGAIEVSSNTLELLPPGHSLAVAERVIQRSLAGTSVLNAFVDTKRAGGALDADVLAKLDRFQRAASALAEVDASISLLDHLERLKAAFGPAEPRELVFIHTAPEDLERYLDEERATLRVLFRLNQRRSTDLARVARALEAEAEKAGFARGELRVASTSLLFGHSFDAIASQMLFSIVTSAGLIVPTLLLLTRSLRVTLIAVAPNTLPSLLVVGFMGVFGYKLDFVNSTIASLTLGIAVDDTIHFLAKFLGLRDAGADVAEALERALREAGPAMLLGAGVLSGSLLLLCFSDFLPIRNLGQLAAFGFGACALADLTLHPALLVLFAPRPAREGAQALASSRVA
jgi:predicted RND superfamily exporter protein